MSRGRLRIYLGAAPGVGKTFAMLSEGRADADRGMDVVVAYAETYGRPRTAELLEGMELLPRRGGGLDLDALLARRPQIALVDELAHACAPGSRNAHHWQDVQQALDAGIDVVSTLNVHHLASLKDVVERITGLPQRDPVPDEVVRQADQVELVDMSPESLLRRMAHGDVFAIGQMDAALSEYFRVPNLSALRELALSWVAGTIDEHHDEGWETRERVVVALPSGPEGLTLIRRAARLAARTRSVELLGVHVTRPQGTHHTDPALLARQRGLLEELGGTYHQVTGSDVTRALLDFARGVNATQIVMGASRRRKLVQLLCEGVDVSTSARSGSIDVHMVVHRGKGRRTPSAGRDSPLPRGRRLTAWALALLGLPLSALVLLLLYGQISLPSEILLFLLMVVGVALVGGMRPAITAAILGYLLLNYVFIPPRYAWSIDAPEDLVSLVVFVLVAAVVSGIVDKAARRTAEAARAGADAEILSTLAGHVLRGEHALPSLLRRISETFTLTSVTLLERLPAARGWQVVSSAGPACERPGLGNTDIFISDDLVLVLRGRVLGAADLRVLKAFAAETAVALRQQRLREEAERSRPLAEADRMRTALLAAVSHDLRTPLSSARAVVENLLDAEVDWSVRDRDAMLRTADASLRKLDVLVANLLDMSRLQAGVLGVRAEPTALEDILPRAIESHPMVKNEVSLDLPEVSADPALLERILANLIANATRYSPRGEKVLITASTHGSRMEIRIVDRGPGIPREAHERVFLPFQRLGDRDNHTGVGLGLALSRGLAEAMGGTLVPETTPGGGLTMVLTLPVIKG